MKYPNVIPALFLKRPNRFIARVAVGGRTETVHVKNTGRCRELLKPDAEVWLTAPGTPGRKTKYDLVAVRKDTGALFNIDSQAPNAAAKEWLFSQGFDKVASEHRYGESRIDFYMEKDGERYLMEVKGCTLEIDGRGYFPDAPTERGMKHVRELIRAVNDGYHAVLAFVIQTENVTEVQPNAATDPAFAQAVADARQAGVTILFLPCIVEPDCLSVRPEIRFPFTGQE